MKIVEFDERRGSVKVRVEDEDDLWLLRSIIVKDDVVYARTLRDVKVDGSRGKRRIPLYLGIKVKSVEFQAFTGRLRIRGVIIDGPEEYGLKGSHHTITLDIGSEVEIVKPEWSRYFIRRLLRGTRRRYKVLLVALDYDECSLALLYEQGVRYLLDKEFPSIGKGGSESSINEAIVNAAIELIKEAVERFGVNAVVIASPAFLKDDVASAVREVLRSVKVFTDSVSVGGRAGISELLRRDLVKSIVSKLSSVKAEEVLNEFMRYVVKNPKRVAYGIDEVEKAAEYGAVAELLVLDELLYKSAPEVRERLERILDLVDERGGEVTIVSKESPAGLRLKGFSGIIAILRFELDLST